LRRIWLSILASLSLVAVGACGAPRAATPGGDPGATERRVLAIADAIVADGFEQFPERTAMLRPPGARYDALPDDSLAGVATRRERAAARLRELRAIDAARELTPGSPAALAYALGRARLEDLEAAEVCRFELWSVSQMLNGWQLRFGNLAQLQPVGTDELRSQALARFGALPGYGDVQTANLRAGLARGYRAPAVLTHLVVAQLDGLLAMPIEESPFWSPAARDGDPVFREQFTVLVRDRIHPALRRHRDFLRDEYLAAARTEPGVAANPDGAACYRAAARLASTLDRDPAEIHRLGWERLAAVEGKMAELSEQSFGGAPVPELLKRFRDEPRYRYRDAEHVRAVASSSIERAQAALPRAFGLLPRSPAVLEPIPAYQERTAAPHYLSAALDGSRPAAYRMRLYRPTDQSWVIGESTAFHEVVPGHHLQIDIANQRDELPAIARFLFNSGFSEGWALYAEELADDLGLYGSDADRFGRLSNEAWRAVRMIVDTGLHTEGWDRQRALDLLLAHTALSPDQAGAEIDRYIAWPGQAPSYMLGYLEIRRLRAAAERALGPRFDLRAFHDRVLENGNVTLPVLRERVEDWLAEPPAGERAPAALAPPGTRS
jgi:uncharacterized protein (DUF885 family)